MRERTDVVGILEDSRTSGPPAPVATRSAKRCDRVVLLSVLIVLASAGSLWRSALAAPGIDFYQFWLAGDVARSGEPADLYSADAREQLARIGSERAADQSATARLRRAARERPAVEVFSTPFLYAVFGIAASGDYERDYRRFQLVSLIAGLAAIAMLSRSLGHGWAESLLAMGLLGPYFEPAHSDVVVGNVNRLLLFALALFVALDRGRPVVAGLVLGAATAFKPTLALSAALLLGIRLVDRDVGRLVREGSGLAIGSVCAVAVSIASFGSIAPWLHWMQSVRELFVGFDLPVRAGNFSFVQIVLEATGMNAGGWLTALVAASLVVVLSLRARARRAAAELDGAAIRRDTEARDGVLALGAGVAATLLVSRLAWLHYYLLAVVLVVALLSPSDRRTRVLVINGAALAAYLLISLIPFRISEAQDPLLAAASAAAGALLLFACAAAELVRSRRCRR